MEGNGGVGLAGGVGAGRAAGEGRQGAKAGGWPCVCSVTRDMAPCPALA